MATDLINVGKISGVFGIKGWFKVFSFTDVREDILTFSPWTLKKGEQTQIHKVVDGGLQGKAIVAKLEGIEGRNQAEALIGWQIFITPDQLPKPKQGEYYWSDLTGLAVETVSGLSLGIVDHLLETGANDVVVVKGERERAIPFLQPQVIVQVDLVAGKMIVDWDPEF